MDAGGDATDGTAKKKKKKKKKKKRSRMAAGRGKLSNKPQDFQVSASPTNCILSLSLFVKIISFYFCSFCQVIRIDEVIVWWADNENIYVFD